MTKSNIFLNNNILWTLLCRGFPSPLLTLSICYVLYLNVNRISFPLGLTTFISIQVFPSVLISWFASISCLGRRICLHPTLRFHARRIFEIRVPQREYLANLVVHVGRSINYLCCHLRTPQRLLEPDVPLRLKIQVLNNIETYLQVRSGTTTRDLLGLVGSSWLFLALTD